MTLATAPKGIRLILMHGGLSAQGHDSAGLSAIGLHPGDDAVVVGSAPFGGPILVELPTTGVRVAVGRARAAGISVQLAE